MKYIIYCKMYRYIGLLPLKIGNHTELLLDFWQSSGDLMDVCLTCHLSLKANFHSFIVKTQDNTASQVSWDGPCLNVVNYKTTINSNSFKTCLSLRLHVYINGIMFVTWMSFKVHLYLISHHLAFVKLFKLPKQQFCHQLPNSETKIDAVEIF